MKLLRSAVRNVGDGIVCYPGESEGEKGLMTSEPYSLPTFPEMPKQGASYQSREWNTSVDGFALPRWQPAPLLNTLWKQFLLCNAGESQQIINLSQYSPSARKSKSRLRSCKGIPLLSLKDCQCLIIASDTNSHCGPWLGQMLIFSTLKGGEAGCSCPPTATWLAVQNGETGIRRRPTHPLSTVCFILTVKSLSHTTINSCVYV